LPRMDTDTSTDRLRDEPTAPFPLLTLVMFVQQHTS
jgi:hypothetical protein